MKVYINREIVTGPWGGGNKTLNAIINSLNERGHNVTHIFDESVDVLFCFDPRQGSSSNQLDYVAMYNLRNYGNKKRKLLQRVGDIGTHGKPELTELVLKSVEYSDLIIFPSHWACYTIQYNLKERKVQWKGNMHVVHNAPESIFYSGRLLNCRSDELPQNISFVTHHWSNNKLKGFDFYDKFSKWCESNGHKFTFFGRAPINSKFNVLGPLDAASLAVELPKCDVYVTASVYEAGANHVLEAIAAGLPVIYHGAGGSIPEYCLDYGKQFNGTIEDFEDTLKSFRLSYASIKENIKTFKRSSGHVGNEYVDLIESAI